MADRPSRPDFWCIEIVEMRVPAVDNHLDKRHAGFHQSPREQATERKGAGAIGIANRL